MKGPRKSINVAFVNFVPLWCDPCLLTEKSISLAQQRDQVAFDGPYCANRGVAARDAPGAIDQKLGEVPLDLTVRAETRLLRFEVGKHRVGIGAIHRNLREERKGHGVVAGAKRFDRRFVYQL